MATGNQVYDMISGIGDAFSKSYDAAKRKGALTDIGDKLKTGDYTGAAQAAIDAGDLSTGTSLLKLGEGRDSMKQLGGLLGGMYGGGASGGLSGAAGQHRADAVDPSSSDAPTFAGGSRSMTMPSGDSAAIQGQFTDALKAGGLTNPYGLAAMTAYAQHESRYSPDNITGSWSDPSESGQAGTSGGILSWRGDRLSKMRAMTAGAQDPVTAQAKFALVENPDLTMALQSAKSAEEANSLMANAWRFAGYDRQGGEFADRLATTRAYVDRFGGGGGAGGGGTVAAGGAPTGLTLGTLGQPGATQTASADQPAGASGASRQAPDAMPTDSRPAWQYPVGNEPGAFGTATGPTAGRPQVAAANPDASGQATAGTNGIGLPEAPTRVASADPSFAPQAKPTPVPQAGADLKGDFPVRMPDGKFWTVAQAKADNSAASPYDEDVAAAQDGVRRSAALNGGRLPPGTPQAAPAATSTAPTSGAPATAEQAQISAAAPQVLTNAGVPPIYGRTIAGAEPGSQKRIATLVQASLLPGLPEAAQGVIKTLLSNELDQSKLNDAQRNYQLDLAQGYRGSFRQWREAEKEKPDKTPDGVTKLQDAQKNWQAYKLPDPSDPANTGWWREFSSKILGGAPGSVINNIPAAAEKAGSVEGAKLDAEAVRNAQNVTMPTLRAADENFQLMQDAMERNGGKLPTGGALAGMGLDFNRTRQYVRDNFGIDLGGSPDELKNLEAFQKGGIKAAGDLAKAIGGSRVLKVEFEQAGKAQPGIDMSNFGNKYLLDTNRKGIAIQQEYLQAQEDWYRTHDHSLDGFQRSWNQEIHDNPRPLSSFTTAAPLKAEGGSYVRLPSTGKGGYTWFLRTDDGDTPITDRGKAAMLEKASPPGKATGTGLGGFGGDPGGTRTGGGATGTGRGSPPPTAAPALTSDGTPTQAAMPPGMPAPPTAAGGGSSASTGIPKGTDRTPFPPGYDAARTLFEARQAVRQGKDKAWIGDKLRSYGIDPRRLDD